VADEVDFSTWESLLNLPCQYCRPLFDAYRQIISELLLGGIRAGSEDVLPLDGTFPMRTSTPIASSASLIPTQYENCRGLMAAGPRAKVSNPARAS
jgi:hypothetical protein